MRIAIIAPGEMGAGIGARLRARGAEVTTSLAGRGEASAARARAAGMEAVADDDALAAGADLVLSIVPPAQALALAQRLAPALGRTGGRVAYVDCNAVAPETVRGVGEIVAAAGCPFVDGGIIGGPPKGEDAGPRLYVAGEAARSVEPLAGFGIDVRVVGGGIGAASALKMAYATITKGLTALGTLSALGASAAGVGADLRAELAHSQPGLAALLARQVPGMVPKAYRWVAEMEEIAAFLRSEEGGGAGDAARMLEGAAALYHDVAHDQKDGGSGRVEVLRGFYGGEG